MPITSEKLVGEFTPATVSRNGERGRGISGRREMTDGSHQSARGREELGTVSGLREAGPWARSGAGPKGFPRGLFLFLFSFASFLFCFLYFFTPFSNLNQIDPTQLCKVSKIQNNHTEQ
jgi:hypothetical protein